VAEQLVVEQQQLPESTLLSASGEIDLASVGELESALGSALEAGATRVVLDLRGVSFLDSTGLRALIAAHTQMEEVGGSLALVVDGGPVERLFEITGIGSTLNIHRTVEAATG
jgi:anti-sigma B factor antagonist